MEDLKPSIGSVRTDGGAGGGDMEARFAEQCKGKLGLDESAMKQATLLFRESKPILLGSISSFGSGTPEEIERNWSCFILFCVSKLGNKRKAKEESGIGISLCQILRAFKLSIIDFFKEVPQFCLKCGYILTDLYGHDWEKRLELKELQANIVHLSLLSRYYKRAYQELFLPNSKNGTQNGEDSEYYRFGWLLFLQLRVHAFSWFKDLVTCTNGLVSILAVLILHVPSRLRNFSMRDSSHFARRSEKGVNLIGSLCDKYHTSEDELRSALEKTNSLIAGILQRKPCPASNFSKESLDFIDPEGLTYFEDLMEENQLQASLVTLENEYEREIYTKGELDERMFVNEEDSLLGSGSLSGGAINLSGSKQRKYDVVVSPAKSITSPMMSPPNRTKSKTETENGDKTETKNGNGSGNDSSRQLAPFTPVSTAMTTARWLRTTICPLPQSPNPNLLHYFSSCDRNLTNDIIRRAHIILSAIFTPVPTTTLSLTTVSRMDSIWAEQRKTEALKLYYRVLESICTAESNLQNPNPNPNLTPLLSNERFHRCMLACSAELVLATHKTVNLIFPAVLEKTGVTAFDLSKVIEGFVRHEETLPRELKRHLNSLEEKLLESLAWEKGSALYNSLIVARPGLAGEINRLGLLAEPVPSLDSIAAANQIATCGGLPPLPFPKTEILLDQNEDLRSPKRARIEPKNVLMDQNLFKSPVKENQTAYLSPFKSKLLPLHSSFASPTRPNPAGGGQTCAETGIDIFFSKISKLAAIRIRTLSERLGLTQQVLEGVYSLVQQILSQKTALFFNRHIDQIILCSIYGVSKICQLSLTFKEIIFSYRKQPQCKSQVFRSVYVNWPSGSHNGKTGEEHVDIIKFYNEVFIPCVKPLLVELGPSGPTHKNNNKPTEERGTADGAQYPGSPKISNFPNLPDMSPKKVSSSHNVYVSPLRSTKRDSLLSPSSKSYYACVGESTHAYQSPSKDLTAINNRLNCGRKVNGRLNFDIVSDSVVAGSFATSAPAVTASLKSIVKCEQLDS